ncbi:MAG: AAA-like domain-containing protein [Clostridiales bacterium]|nr:AAA-like domain-containing protein [Clostridiales bacterium]
MQKTFNVNGPCRPDRHYMVNLESRLAAIRKMVSEGKYFTINRARQYGKTTTLRALVNDLWNDFTVLSLDFQRIETAEYESGSSFVHAMAREICKRFRQIEQVPDEVRKKMTELSEDTERVVRMAELFSCFSEWCEKAERPLVLIIDEVDTAANNQVFLDFLAQLRAAYLDSDVTPTFQSVILAGVYDVRSIKRKIRDDSSHMENSPWNIAADFLVDMSFSSGEIAGMLEDYEKDYRTGMDVSQIASLLYDYTSGYPYLVSRLCSFMDERLPQTRQFSDKREAWTKRGLLSAVKMLLEDENPLFESLNNKLKAFPELNAVIARLLFQGQSIAYNADDPAMKDARMFGFVKVKNSTIQIANRIFENRLYNQYLLDYKDQNSEVYMESSRQKNCFIINGFLNMRMVLEKFVETFDFLYGDRDATFLEEEGRRYFMLFLRPIINGEGNCYVEPETRNRERMDLVIDYHGEQYVCELKIWHGNAYNERGERQIMEYLDYFHLEKGYMLSFNFNREKSIGVQEIVIGNKLLIEAVV